MFSRETVIDSVSNLYESLAVLFVVNTTVIYNMVDIPVTSCWTINPARQYIYLVSLEAKQLIKIHHIFVVTHSTGPKKYMLMIHDASNVLYCTVRIEVTRTLLPVLLVSSQTPVWL
jgi:uncharacterized protein (UPF0333 family)